MSLPCDLPELPLLASPTEQQQQQQHQFKPTRKRPLPRSSQVSGKSCSGLPSVLHPSHRDSSAACFDGCPAGGGEDQEQVSGKSCSGLPSALPLLGTSHGREVSCNVGSQDTMLGPGLAVCGNSAQRPKPFDIVFGGDFSGVEIAFEAAVDVAELSCGNLRAIHAWSGDVDKGCQKFLKSNRPGHLLQSVSEPLPPALPAINMYAAGFPCQPWSMEGKQLGLRDERGRLVWPMLDRLESVSGSLMCFLLENCSNLVTSAKHKHDFDTILDELRRRLPGFNIFTKVLDALGWGLPQSRKRVYIVGLRVDKQVSTWVWPRPTHEDPVPLSAFLAAPPVLSEEEKKRRVGELTKTGQRNVEIACKDIKKLGFDPAQVLCCIDVDSGRTTGKLWKMTQARTLTRARGGCGGPWLSTHWRRTSVQEMASFQGLNLDTYDLTGLTNRQVGQMLPGVALCAMVCY